MMKGIFLLAIFACVALAQNNYGVFFDNSLLTEFSGVAESLNSLSNFTVSDQTKKKTVFSNLSITNGKAWRSYLNTSSIVGTFDKASNTYTYTGFDLTVNFTFKFADPFTTAWVNGTVSGSYGVSKDSFVKVTYAINETSKGPIYTLQTGIVLTDLKADFSAGNDTVRDDILPWLQNETLNELNLSVNNQVLLNMTAYYQQRTESFVRYHEYSFDGLSATIDYGMLSIGGQEKGLKIIYDGGIVNYSVPPSSIPDFDPSLAPTQALLTKNFIEAAISYPLSKGFFKWSFPDASSLRMPDLDFKASDLYFIFPDSIGEFGATDPLKAECDLSGSTGITFNTEANRIEITQKLDCTVKVAPGTGSETKIMDFSVPVVFYPDISLSGDSKLIIQLSDTILQESVSVNYCKYAMQPRQQAIIDTLVQEAFENYDSENNVWGTNFQILPMKGAYYRVRSDGILFFGSHH